jgi:hypothetical protein
MTKGLVLRFKVSMAARVKFVISCVLESCSLTHYNAPSSKTENLTVQSASVLSGPCVALQSCTNPRIKSRLLIQKNAVTADGGRGNRVVLPRRFDAPLI